MVDRNGLVRRIKRSKDRQSLSRSLTVRLPTKLYGKLEAYAGKLAADMPGVDLTVSDVVRNLLEQALKERNWRKTPQQRRQEAQELVDQLNRDPPPGGSADASGEPS